MKLCAVDALGKDLGRVWSFACYSSNYSKRSIKCSSNIRLVIAFPPCLLISTHSTSDTVAMMGTGMLGEGKAPFPLIVLTEH
jgi:hypothetical protein